MPLKMIKRYIFIYKYQFVDEHLFVRLKPYNSYNTYDKMYTN